MGLSKEDCLVRKFALLVAAITIPATMLLSVRPASAAIDTTRDCDTVAIIKCGALSVSELRGDAKQGDVPRVFANFGISQSKLNGFVDGVVWKDGRVTLGSRGEGRLVANNAVTAGRWNNPTSDMTRIPNTDRAYRMSTSHFTDDGQIAFIKVVNGTFQFAVIKTCGNPVTATPVTPPPAPPPAPPNITVTKDVSTRPSGAWQQTVTVKPGDHVRFRIIGKNTGKVVLDRVSVQDVLPSGISQVMTNTTLNGVPISNSVTGGLALPALQPGQQFILIFEAATVATENRPAACQTGLINTGIVRTGGVLPDKSDTAVVRVCKPTQPPAPETPPITPPTPPTPTPTPPVTPGKLVDTGPGTVVGVVMSVATASTLAYRIVMSRRFF